MKSQLHGITQKLSRPKAYVQMSIICGLFIRMQNACSSIQFQFAIEIIKHLSLSAAFYTSLVL